MLSVVRLPPTSQVRTTVILLILSHKLKKEQSAEISSGMMFILSLAKVAQLCVCM